MSKILWPQEIPCITDIIWTNLDEIVGQTDMMACLKDKTYNLKKWGGSLESVVAESQYPWDLLKASENRVSTTLQSYIHDEQSECIFPHVLL